MFVRGTTFAKNHALSADTIFCSAGDDSKVCIWSLNGLKRQYEESLGGQDEDAAHGRIFKNYKPKATYASN